MRTVLAYETAKHRREIVTCVQDPTGVAFGDWQNLGAPDGDDPVKSMEAGYPVGAALPDGTVQVFARSWSGSVGVRTLDGPWTILPLPPEAGPGVQDGLGVVVDADGRTQLFAPARTVVHWAADTPGGPLRPMPPTGLPTPGGPVSALLAEDGTLRLHLREPKSAKVLVAELRPQRADGSQSPAPSPSWRITAESTPPGGFGRVSATVNTVAVRDGHGHVALRTGRAWQHGGPLLAGTPAVHLDAQGLAVAGALGCDGQLYTARQTKAGGPFGGWRQAV